MERARQGAVRRGITLTSLIEQGPAVHDGTAEAMRAQRALALDVAFAAHPIRFKGIAPKPPELPTAAWINPPKKETTPPACSLIS